MKLAPLCLLLLVGCATSNLPNLQLIYPNMTCSGRPTATGWQMLHDIGITQAVILATVREVPDPDARYGIAVRRFPLNACQQFFGPVAAKLEQAALNISPGTAVICSHGRNRSRTVIIAWRVRYCGWTRADAIKEADDYDWWSSFPALLWYGRHVK